MLQPYRRARISDVLEYICKKKMFFRDAEQAGYIPSTLDIQFLNILWHKTFLFPGAIEMKLYFNGLHFLETCINIMLSQLAASPEIIDVSDMQFSC